MADDHVDEQMVGAAFEKSHESKFTAVGVPGRSGVDRRAIRFAPPGEYEPNEPLKVGVVENELLQSGAQLVGFDGERPVISPRWYICECSEGQHALDEVRQ